MSKSIISKPLILIVVGFSFVAGYYFFTAFNKSEIDIRKFTGEVVSVEGETVTLRGVYSGPAGTIPEDLLSVRTFRFRIDTSTGFKKLETSLPTWEELTADGATSGSYNLEDLPRVEGPSSLEELKGSLSKGATSVEADFSYSIHRSKDPVASHIFYHTIIEPPRPFLPQTP